MTLIEIIVVVAIITLVVGGVSVVAINRLNESKLSIARNETIKVQNLVEMYMVTKRSKCPKNMQDLVSAGIATKVSKDPWGKEYTIKCPGEKMAVDIISSGPDGELGNDDDIANYSEDSEEEAS